MKQGERFQGITGVQLFISTFYDMCPPSQLQFPLPPSLDVENTISVFLCPATSWHSRALGQVAALCSPVDKHAAANIKRFRPLRNLVA